MNLFSGIKTIQIKILLWSGISLFLLATVIITVAAISLRTAATDNAQQEAVAVAEHEAANIEAELNLALDVSRTLAQSLTSLKDENSISLSRDQVNAMLFQVIQANPQFFGVYTLWEPNAFDGQDSNYINAAAHDQTGRFIPYWFRDLDNNIGLEALVEYDIPGVGDWYLRPKNTQREQVLSPFLYPVQGEEVLMSSFVIPIVVDNQFYGITGVDLRVDFLQSLADEINVLDGVGKAAIISNEGTLAGVTGQPELIGKSGAVLFQNFDELLPRIQAGENFVLTRSEENLLLIFVPIHFGNTDITWSVALSVPLDVVTAGATASVWQLVGIGVALTLATLVLLSLIAGQIAQPIKSITATAQEIAAGNLTTPVQVNTQDEIGVLAASFNSMTAQLRQSLDTLEQQVERRTQRLEEVATISGQLLGILDREQLLVELVNRVKERFNYYHAHIYLVDEAQQALALEAGAGQIGVEMKAQGHHIALDAQTSLVARAARTREVVRVDNVRKTPDWLPNPLLPDTYSEMAVPIILEGEVVGVLDVQEDRIAGLDDGDANLLRSLANQVAIAIRNTRLFDEAQSALAEARAVQQQYVTAAWDRDRVARRGRGRVQFSLGESSTLRETEVLQARQMALSVREPQLIALNDTESEPLTEREDTTEISTAELIIVKSAEQAIDKRVLVAPITLHDVIVGDLQLHEGNNSKVWSARELALIDTVLDQVAQAAENLRLVEDIQERASREQLINQITTKLRRAPDMESLLEIGTTELGQILKPARTFVKLGQQPPQSKSSLALPEQAEGKGIDGSNGSNSSTHKEESHS